MDILHVGTVILSSNSSPIRSKPLHHSGDVDSSHQSEVPPWLPIHRCDSLLCSYLTESVTLAMAKYFGITSINYVGHLLLAERIIATVRVRTYENVRRAYFSCVSTAIIVSPIILNPIGR